MSDLFEKLLKIVERGRATVDDLPLPVDEGVCVRLPSWADERYVWQGATVMHHGEVVRLQADDGRTFEAPTVEGVYEAWGDDDAACWRFQPCRNWVR